MYKLYYTPKLKTFVCIKNVASTGFKKGMFFEREKESGRYIAKDSFGLKLLTRRWGYTSQEVSLLELMGILKLLN